MASRRTPALFVPLAAFLCFALPVAAQDTSPAQGTPPSPEKVNIQSADQRAKEEIAIEHCDRLPVVKLRINAREMSFLLDTAATSILNVKSFTAGGSKDIQISSWTGTAVTSAREVTLAELSLGKHTLKNIKLPAIDLSPIGKACGGSIDGILGLDLIQRMGLTIDLQRQVGLLDAGPVDAKAKYDEMEAAMHVCNVAFNLGKADVLESCFDPEIVLYALDREFRGRKEVMEYLRNRFFKFAPNLRFEMAPRDVRLFGDALWYSYDYNIESPTERLKGHGMAMCHRSEGRWLIVNMHNSLLPAVQQD